MKHIPFPVILAAIIAISGTLYWTAPSFMSFFSTDGGVVPPAQQSRAAPEAQTGFLQREQVVTKEFMVAAANPHASKAGVEIIQQGGTAMDAAIAVQLALNVVEPQSSGIGGGAFLLYWDKQAGALKSYDGRETAPAAVTEAHFLREDGSKLSFSEAVRSGRSIGVPGVVKMMFMAHQKHGKLPWKDLFKPAIALAADGFPLSPRLHKMLKRKGRDFFNEEAQRLFFDEDGAAFAIGTIHKNPALAQSFKVIAKLGVDGFYKGDVASKIIDVAAKAPSTPSLMSLADLNAYTAVERPAVCSLYLSFNVCGMGAPSSGGLTVAMTLKLIEPFALGEKPNAAAMHLIAEAEKLAFADRNRYIADPDFTTQPLGFLSTSYLNGRRALIKQNEAMPKASAGDVPLAERAHYGVDETVELGGTSHISIIDKEGNAVSMTSSIEGAFGSGQMAGGFLLNNQLTDFSFKVKDKSGKLIANRVEPNKRPRSSMSPSIVFDQKGQLKIIVGSPGGSRIILFVVKALVAHLNWGLGPQGSVSLVNFGSRNGPFELENLPKLMGKSAISSKELPAYYHDLAQQLSARGQNVKLSVMTSGAQMIVTGDQKLIGGADPRREGAVMGE